MRSIRSISVRYRPFTRKTRKETKAAMEWVVDTRFVILDKSRISVDGCLLRSVMNNQGRIAGLPHRSHFHVQSTSFPTSPMHSALPR
jgi:hypothetical protein